MDEAPHKLVRRLPGVSFNELEPLGSILIREAFYCPFFGSTPITSHFIFPGQQLRGLLTLEQRLRDIPENRNHQEHTETVEILKSIDKIPVPSCRLKDLMARQLWRLQDLRDGGGLGFMIEPFPPLTQIIFIHTVIIRVETCTFKAITSSWESSRDSSGTQRILPYLICDLVVKRRGVFSDLSYQEYIMEGLLGLVGNMVESGEYDTTLLMHWRNCGTLIAATSRNTQPSH